MAALPERAREAAEGERTVPPGGAAARRDAAGDQWTAPVAILAPAGQDGSVAAGVLMRAGFTPRVCADMPSLCAAVRAGDDVGALLVAEEALAGEAREALLVTLAAQPPWSDLPVVVLTGEGELSSALSPALEIVTARTNATLLERPVRVATLVTALRSALRARRRQLDVRDHLAERAASEEALRAARAQAEVAQAAAEEANRSKSEFLAVMSHELRTPLNAIGGYAELIELGIRGPITAEQQADLARIQKSQRHLLGLINGVLNYARVEAGAIYYEIVDVPIDDVLATCEALIAPQVKARGLTLRLEPVDHALTVRADLDKVQQIVLNLLSNAVKFTEPGGVITLGCDEEGEVVRVRVRDTGRGILPEQLPRIFEPFVQVDAKLTRTEEGTGLGLAISRDLARGMGGDLTAESVPGEGSTFTLALRRG